MILTGISDMYWITRLSQIHDALLVAFVTAFVAMFLTGICILVFSGEKDDSILVKNIKKYFVTAMVIAIFSGTVSVFVPRTNEALLIYGVGTTIDYVDNNETIKQLPDKAVQALDKYLDSLNEDKQNEKSHN